MESSDVQRVLEAVLLCAQQPLSVPDLQRLLEADLLPGQVLRALHALQAQWATRGMRLVEVVGGWRFQSAPELRVVLDRLHPEKPPRYTRATLETLAIVAYKQPVTRGDIEDIRGVAVNAQALKQLEERGWIEVVGHRETVGRPALFATTAQFLVDLGLRSVAELPPLVAPSSPSQVLQAILPQGQGGRVDVADDALPAPVFWPQVESADSFLSFGEAS
jgi:segregation and condensation protein B